MRSITRLKNFKWLFAAVIIAGTIFQACKKNVDVESTPLNNEFTPVSVKEWYYSTFKKSAEWASAKEHGKKLPDWKNGIKTKIAGWDAIEFPLSKSISSFSISAGQLTQAGCKRLANASIAKVAFIKTKNNEIVVREVDYIPDWQYLQSKRFDISAVNTSTVNDFTGRVVIKKWDGSVIATKIVVNGKAVKTAMKKDVEAKGATATNSLENCTTYEVCEWVRDCEIHYYGDGYIVQECSEWANTYCWYEQECTGGGDDCENYGIGCGGEGGGDAEPQAVQSIQNNILNNCLNAVYNHIHAQTYKNQVTAMLKDLESNSGVCVTFNENSNMDPDVYGSTYGTGGENYNIDLNTDNLPHCSQEFIASIYFHEVIHAYLKNHITEYDFLNNSEHALMLTKYFNDFVGAVKSAYPSLSDLSAWAICFAGINYSDATSAQDQMLINVIKTKMLIEIDKKYPGTSLADIEIIFEQYTESGILGTRDSNCQ